MCSGLLLQFVDALVSVAKEKFTQRGIVFTSVSAEDGVYQPYIQLLLFRKLGSPTKCRKIAGIVTERT
jgi:hypothetical protein